MELRDYLFLATLLVWGFIELSTATHPLVRHVRGLAEHKWYVLVAGRRLGVGWWRLLTHDLSKLHPIEVRGYAIRYYGASPSSASDVSWARAWRHHVACNDHHPDHWESEDHPGGAGRMPDSAIREMVADWLAASRSYEGKWPNSTFAWPWFVKAFDGLKLHPGTRGRVYHLLDDYFAKYGHDR